MTLKTINYEIQCLQTFFHWAIRQNYLFTNPTTFLKLSYELLIPNTLFEEELLKLPASQKNALLRGGLKVMDQGKCRSFAARCETASAPVHS